MFCYSADDLAAVNPHLAAEAFRALRTSLTQAVGNPVELASDLYSNFIISAKVKKLALDTMTGRSECERTVLVLDSVEGWLGRDPSHFKTLVDLLLNTEALTPDFGIQLIEAFRKLYISIMYNIRVSYWWQIELVTGFSHEENLSWALTVDIIIEFPPPPPPPHNRVPEVKG